MSFPFGAFQAEPDLRGPEKGQSLGRASEVYLTFLRSAFYDISRGSLFFCKQQLDLGNAHHWEQVTNFCVTQGRSGHQYLSNANNIEKLLYELTGHKNQSQTLSHKSFFFPVCHHCISTAGSHGYHCTICPRASLNHST